MSLTLLALSLIAAAPGPARPTRHFEQTVTVAANGDASVQLVWRLPANEYQTLQSRLGGTKNVPGKDGKTVAQVQKPTDEGVIHYFNLKHLDVVTDAVTLTQDDTKKTITATFKV